MCGDHDLQSPLHGHEREGLAERGGLRWVQKGLWLVHDDDWVRSRDNGEEETEQAAHAVALHLKRWKCRQLGEIRLVHGID
jgi:hypothetical protein